MRRLLEGLAALLVLATVATAQAQSQSVRAGLTSATCPGSGCLVLSVSGVGGVAVQVTGTFVGTLSFEGSIDGVNYVPLGLLPIASTSAVTSTTATGLWSGGVGGMAVVRVRMSAYTSGTATVSIQNAPTSSRATGGGGGGGGTIGGSIAAGQVPVGSGADAIAGSANFLFDSTTQALTIGAASGSSAASFWAGYPFVYVEEQAGDLTPGFVSYAYSTIANASGGNFPMRSRGTPASPTAVLSGDKLGVAVEPAAYTGAGWGYSGTLYMEASENWSGTATGSRFVMKVTPNGENQTASKQYTFAPATMTVPGGLNVSGGAFTVDGSGNATVASCTGCGGGAWVKIESKTAASSSSLNFTTGIGATYDQYRLEFVDVVPSTDDVSLWVRLSHDGGSTWDTASNSYFYGGHDFGNNVTSGLYNDATAGRGSTAIPVGINVDNSGVTGLIGYTGSFSLFRPSNAARHKFRAEGDYLNQSNIYVHNIVSGRSEATTAVNGMQVVASSGNLSTGTVTLYGLVK